ncbi:extracellular catalytic domain type 1 short-chain-length polyhydroxyalkanoate depolymerase [Hymenobacter translucens]|uniref:extracellular catalytic domain type 1 short-chain-length polyhydroxyalkanoate depolymerase n=1 Tax=Hymenobacter translucens TaxID=2886507 RepID=UPI001D0E6911|nr:PHB depolymerase family esterase [Hymenobacter translucens]
MLLRLKNLLLLLLLSAGVVPLQAQTTIQGSIRCGGLRRDYRLYVPAAYRAGTPVPLLFNLHGYGSSNVEQEIYGDFRAIADTANFLVVHPNGTIEPGSGSRYWNTFGPPGTPGPDDVAFLSALIDSLRLRYSIDPDRVYSTGMSNGGFMSFELACKLSGRIAAVASVTGSMTGSRIPVCTPQHPTPILQIHGTADNTVPYNGGTALAFASIPTVLNYWVQFNGCNPTPTITMLPNLSTTDGSTAERSVWTGGRNGSVVEHYRIIGGGHTWPGAPFTIGVTNRDINASQVVWRFLRRFRLSRLTLATASAAAPALAAYPNPFTSQLTLRLSPGVTISQLTLLNPLGQKISLANARVSNGVLQLSTGNWPAGLYLLRVEAGGQLITYKLLRAKE